MKLRDHIKERLSSVRGDTLVEALVALLIAALGASALATMVMASVNVSMRSQESLDALYTAESAMTSGSSSSVTINIPAEGSRTNLSSTITCTLYQGSDDGNVVFMRYEEKL